MEVVGEIQKKDNFDTNMKAVGVWKTHGKPSIDSAKKNSSRDDRGIFTHETIEKYVDEGR